MEPVFMQLGQAAAMAAGIAAREGLDVQAVPYARVRDQLKAANLPVEWSAAAAPPKSKAKPAAK
jgi:hypothetical protein